VQQGASWKMHALNNADAAVKRARLAAANAEALATQARERADKVARENPNDRQLMNAANATAAVVIGYNDSAHSHAIDAKEAFDSTSIFKRARRNSKPATSTVSHDNTEGNKFREIAQKYLDEAKNGLAYVKLADDASKQVQEDDLKQAILAARRVNARAALLAKRAVDRATQRKDAASKTTAALVQKSAQETKDTLAQLDGIIGSSAKEERSSTGSNLDDDSAACQLLARRSAASDGGSCRYSSSVNLDDIDDLIDPRALPTNLR